MSEITMALDIKNFMEWVIKNNKNDEYGEDDENYWLRFNQLINECYFDYGHLHIDFNYKEDEEPYLSIDIPLAELLEQFEKFDVAEDMEEHTFENLKSIKKLVILMNKIKKQRKKQQEEYIKKLEKRVSK